MNSVLERAEKKKKTFDMMISMHCKMRDNYNKWNVAFDCLEILTSVVLCGITFFNYREFFSEKFGMAISFFSILIFAFTLIKQRLNFKKKSEQHSLAGKMYSSAKLDLEQQIILWKESETNAEDILLYIKEKYLALTELTPIPEKKFHKLKHHHQYKIEFSKFLDNHKSTPWLLCKIKFSFSHDNQ